MNDEILKEIEKLEELEKYRHRIVDVGGLHFLLDADVNNSVFSISHFLVLCYGESAGSVN